MFDLEDSQRIDFNKNQHLQLLTEALFFDSLICVFNRQTSIYSYLESTVHQQLNMSHQNK